MAPNPFWAPNSQSVAFFIDQALERIDLGGSRPRVLASVSSGRGGTWGVEGVILFAAGASPLFRVSASGDEPVAVTKLDPPHVRSHRFPSFLPGSRKFLFYAMGEDDASGIYVGSLDSPDIKRLTAADTAGAYMPPGPIWSPDGTRIAFTSTRKGVEDIYVKPSNNLISETPLLEGGPIAKPVDDWSRDGRFILYHQIERASARDLWVLPIDGDRAGKPFVFLRTRFDETGGRFSPDGQWVAYESNMSGQWEIYVRSFSESASRPDSPRRRQEGSRFLPRVGFSRGGATMVKSCTTSRPAAS
jgi:Tol biopolymer transport system component